MTHARTSSAAAIVGAMHYGRYERNEQDFMRLVVRPGSPAWAYPSGTYARKVTAGLEGNATRTVN